MRLEPPTEQQLRLLRNWFPDQQAIFSWGGPGMRFPNSYQQFEKDLNLHELASYALLSGGEMLGFGQLYERLQHCHLGRLAIAPEHRGNGHAYALVTLLLETGKSTLGLSRASLFVLRDNRVAIKTYQKLGFTEAVYPERMPLDNCLYLSREI